MESENVKVNFDDLTGKQKRFCEEYVIDWNASRAALVAGYSEKTAYSIGNENLKKPEIRKEIQSAAEKLGITAEYVLGNLKEIADFNKEKRIKARSIGNDIFQEEEMIDVQASIKANDLLGKHLKLFTDQIDIKAEVKTEDQELTDAVRQLLFLATQ